MPLYEYRCDTCKKVHEVMQKFADAPLTTCPECGGPVEKMISLSSFALKGSGWYTTDYKKSGASASTSSPPNPASESAAPATVTEKAPAASTPASEK